MVGVRVLSRRAAVAVCAIASACSSPSAPTPSYAGNYTGTTSQGMPIFLSISSDEFVTDITIAYTYNSCTGSNSFPNLRLPITPPVACRPGSCGDAPGSPYRTFVFEEGSTPQGPRTQVNAYLTGGSTAQGTLSLRDYPVCGTATGVTWNARK